MPELMPSEILNPFGRQQCYELGVRSRMAYGHLLNDFTEKGTLPVVSVLLGPSLNYTSFAQVAWTAWWRPLRPSVKGSSAVTQRISIALPLRLRVRVTMRRFVSTRACRGGPDRMQTPAGIAPTRRETMSGADLP